LDLGELKTLAGITNTFTGLKPITPVENISYTGTEKAELMRKYKIEPGTDAWFRLWFSLPKLTGERPI
jgi:hypothetical protein